MSQTIIEDIFSQDIDRKIEEVIKVDQTNEDDVYNEITEYIATNSITKHFEKVLESYNLAKNYPTEDVGLWISGFFGSGKSSFAKILGNVLENPEIKGRKFEELFLNRVTSNKVRSILANITENIPTKTVVFDISKYKLSGSDSDDISQIVYRVFLRKMGYSTNLKIAEQEITLERRGKYEEFCRLYEEEYGVPWFEEREEVGFAISGMSVILHKTDPHHFRTEDSWSNSKYEVKKSSIDIVRSIREIMKRKENGKTLVLVIDEVGQYVSRNKDRTLDLQGLVETLGMEGKGDTWLVVTSQEKLDEIVDSLEGKRIELARLMDRFSTRVDLVPSDISEVTSKRILGKKASHLPNLKKIYNESVNTLKTYTELNSSFTLPGINADSFVSLYPFVPYQIELIIDIVSGMRLAPGATKHVGGSNRTVIKLAQQVLVHDMTSLRKAFVGSLVTLDMIYDLIKSDLPGEIKEDIREIHSAEPKIPLVAKVAKAIALLQYVDGIPRTKENLAAVLYPAIGSTQLIKDVEECIDILTNMKKIRESDSGYKLQSAQEKSWETVRNGFDPNDAPNEVEDVKEELLKDIFDGYKLRYKNIRTFSPDILLNTTGGGGIFNISLWLKDEEELTQEEMDEFKKKSRNEEKATIFWLAILTDEIYSQIKEIFRSTRMISKKSYEVKSDEESKLLTEEKHRKNKYRRQVIHKIQESFYNGIIVFRGREIKANSSTNDFETARKQEIDKLLPELFPEFEAGNTKVPKDAIQKIIKSPNLEGLPKVFYDKINDFSLIVESDGKKSVNLDHPLLKNISNYIDKRSSFGQKVSGKDIEENFKEVPYGWQFDNVSLAIFLMLRTGQIEITHQGKRYRSFTDTNITNIFKAKSLRSTSITRRKDTLSLETLSKAAGTLEIIYGEEVDLIEASIWKKIKDTNNQELQKLSKTKIHVKNLNLSGLERIEEFENLLKGILESASDDGITTFADESDEIKGNINHLTKLEEAFTEPVLTELRNALDIHKELGSYIKIKFLDESIMNNISRLADNLSYGLFYKRLAQIKTDSYEILEFFKQKYSKMHKERKENIEKTIKRIEKHPEWLKLQEGSRKIILNPLFNLHCTQVIFKKYRCANCSSSYDKIEGDGFRISELEKRAIEKIERLLRPEEKIIRIKVSDIVRSTISSIDELHSILDQLKEYLEEKLVDDTKIILE